LSNTPHISQEDLALYAMQALTPEENRDTQAHLDDCAYCRAALSESLVDIALIGMSTDEKVLPEGARHRLKARIANTPQVAGAAPAPKPVTSIPVREERRPRFVWLGWVAAAATLAIAAYLGYSNVQLERQVSENRGQIAQLATQADRGEQLKDALTSPDAKRVTLTESKQPAHPVGHATYLPKRGALIFVASNLRPLAEDKTYELWLIPADGKAPIPAGLFRPDANGSAAVILPTLPVGVEAKTFGVTIEDAQGSTTPTLPIVMSG
jgi:hypothetical protein